MKSIKKTKLIMLGLLIFSNVGLMTMEQNPIRRLYQSIIDQDVIGVRDAIEQGADVNQADGLYEDILPIFYAVDSGNEEIVQELINAGVDVRVVNQYDHSPLWYAVDQKFINIVEVLLYSGLYNFDDVLTVYDSFNHEELDNYEVIETLYHYLNPLK